MAGGCNAGILLTQRAGRGIARIGEELIIFHLLIQLLKTFGRHVNFAAYLDFLGYMFSAQLLWDRA